MSTLRIGLKHWAPHGPLILAQELGFLVGVDVDFVVSEVESEKEADFAKGQLHALGTTLDYVPFLTQHTPLTRAFLKLGESAGADAIVALQGIQGATDLRNQTVALEPPGTSQLLLMEFLEKHGLAYEQVKIREVAHDKTPAILAEGEVAAIVTWEPYVHAALAATPGSHVLMTSADTPGLIVEVLVATEETLREHRATFKAIARAQLSTVEYIQKHPKQSADRLSRALEVSDTEMAEMLRSVKLAGADDNRAAFGNADASSALEVLAERLAKIWRNQRMIEHVVLPMVHGDAVRGALAHTC